LSERAGRYLRLPAGEPSESLLSLIRPELRSELRTALTRAVELRQNVRSRPVTVGEETVTLHVRPVLEQDDAARGFLLVMFEELGNDTASDTPAAVDEPIVKQLETEIDNLRMELSASTSHHETQTEELRASNEELQALNEELRSAAEELETSKEELQSINEELTTVNQELKVQIEETSIVSNNLQNLIDSTDFGVIFLDRNLRVQLFSPASRAVFNLIGSDIGRPLADITYNIEYAHVLKDAAEVLRSLTPVEREVRTSDDHFYLMRVVLYRTSEDRINGVVLTFVDISKRKQAEEALRQLNETLEQQVVERTEAWRNTRTSFQQAFEAGPTASVITSLDDDRFIEVNAAFTDMTGYTLDEVKGRSARDLGMWSSSRDKEKIEAALTGRDGYRHLQLHLRTKSGAVLDILKSCERVRMDGDEVWLKMFLDKTERNRTQEQLMQSIEAVMTDSDWFSREVMERLSSAKSGKEGSSSLEQLTGRELEILRHVAAGSNDKEIAAALGLRIKTVRNHINNVYSKLGVHSRVEALVWARERGVMDTRD
ncbi:MAG TPA: PAS domain-containing protein, partial [Trueperaceae bacterium]|nr:PAS domain-containing protein [Trueperaceae bacterium]